jgi:hypothetical protein
VTSPGRYAAVGIATWMSPEGNEVPFLLRRFLPRADQMAAAGRHVLRPGERVDVIAHEELGDSELAWLLADANSVQRPSDLNPGDAHPPGDSIVVRLRFGAPVAAHG